MAKVCSRCGKKIGLFSYQSDGGLCNSCDAEVQKAKDIATREIKERLPLIMEQIATTKAINEEEYAFLERLGPDQRNTAFITLVDRWLADGELEAAEDDILEKLHTRLGLDPVKSTFMQKVVPSYYIASIRNEDKLPEQPREPLTDRGIIIKKDEIPHVYFTSALSEMRVSTGFVAGSTGVSLRVMKGVSYRVGGTRGHITKKDELVETTRGVLILTNKRLFLHPEGNTKAVSIPVNKILSYKCFDDGVVLYKEGREKPFVFKFDYPGQAETMGICIGFLCSNY